MSCIRVLILLLLLAPIAGASDLSVIVMDTANATVPNAIVSYQNGAVTTDAQGKGTLTGIPENMSWVFTVSADNFNIYTESLRLTVNESYKTFTISPIKSIGGTPTPEPTIEKPPAPVPDINIRIHVIDTKQAAISLASVNVLGKLRYTNIYGDVDFPLTKGIHKVEVAISKQDFSSFTQTYTIPDDLANDDFKIEVELTSVNPETPPIFDITRLESPISPAQSTSAGRWGIMLILLGLITVLYPKNKKGGKK